MLDIIKDWDGFEQLIADLHKTGNKISVKRNIKMIGKSGVNRQIDIVLSQKDGLYEIKTIIECKYWNKKITRSVVDSLISTINDLNVQKGVIFTKIGCQSGAKKYAKYMNIDIFQIRELTNKEWGLPGRIVDFYMHYISKTISDLKIEFLNPSDVPPNLDIHIPTLNPKIPIISKMEKYKVGFLEELLEMIVHDALSAFNKRDAFIINDGEECTRYVTIPVVVDLTKKNVIITNNGNAHYINKMLFDLSLKVKQTRFVFDREIKYDHVLIVENCINSASYLALKDKSKNVSEIEEIDKEKYNARIKFKNENQQDTLTNGSVMRIILNDWFDPKELVGLIPKAVTKQNYNG